MNSAQSPLAMTDCGPQSNRTFDTVARTLANVPCELDLVV